MPPRPGPPNIPPREGGQPLALAAEDFDDRRAGRVAVIKNHLFARGFPFSRQIGTLEVMICGLRQPYDNKYAIAFDVEARVDGLPVRGFDRHYVVVDPQLDVIVHGRLKEDPIAALLADIGDVVSSKVAR